MMAGVRLFAMLAIVLAAAAIAPAVGAAPRGGSDLPPVALHHEPPSIPPEAAGSGAAPAVTVRVRIDARGKTLSVETTGIQPSGRFDAAFDRVTREAVSKWRFAPALHDGKAVESTLEWTVQFAPLPEDAPWSYSDAEDGPPLPRAAEEGAVAARRRAAGLPPAERRALRERTARDAESHLLEGRRTRAVTEHFEVITDSPATGTPRRIATQLEDAFAAAARLFGDAIPEEVATDKIVTYVFAKHASFGAFAAENPRSLASGGGGFYDPAGLLAFHLELRGGDTALSRVVLDEATRAFLDAHVARPGVTLPLWLEEGLAEYVAASGGTSGKPPDGSQTKRKSSARKSPAKTRGEPPRAEAAEVSKAIRAGGAIPLDRLLAARPEDLEGETARLFPAQSWMWVHFLRHGQPDWSAGAFPRLVLYVAEGYSAADVFPAVYGSPPAGLAAAFREYVKRF